LHFDLRACIPRYCQMGVFLNSLSSDFQAADTVLRPYNVTDMQNMRIRVSHQPTQSHDMSRTR
jgi:hypothetical protein